MNILPLNTQQEERHENFIRLRTPPANSSIQRATTTTTTTTTTITTAITTTATKQQHGNGNEIESKQESKSTIADEKEYEYESSEDHTHFDLSRVFDFIELNKERLGIISYSVSQATLEQIFIQLAKEQQISSSSNNADVDITSRD